MKIKFLLVLFSVCFVGCEPDKPTQSVTPSSSTLSKECLITQPKDALCEGVYLGYEFRPETEECIHVSWGCENPPFLNEKTCVETCTQ